MRIKWLMPLLLIGLLASSCGSVEEKKAVDSDIVFTVTHPWDYKVETENIYLNINSFEALYGAIDWNTVDLVDINNDHSIDFQLLNTDTEEGADYVLFVLDVISREPIRTFEFRKTDEPTNKKEVVAYTDPIGNKLEVSLLTNVTEEQKDTTQWADYAATSFINWYPKPSDLETFAPNIWSYTNGFFINALCGLYQKTDNEIYLDYVENWVDHFVNEEGTVNKYFQEKYRLDDILPARSMLYLYDIDPKPQYKKALDTFAYHLKHQPTTTEGGYWHKKRYENQMWLDGIYMGDVFAVQYGDLFDKPEFFDKAVLQIELIYKHTRDSVTGLMYHGWDESKNDVWANQQSGTSPEFWGRGIGWYMMALVDVLDYIPQDHPEYDRVIEILNELSASLVNVQDEKTKLWYQVLDKGDKEGNWIETSASAMFGYAFAKGAKNGYLPDEYLDKAQEVFDSLIDSYVYLDQKGRFYFAGTVKVGTLNFKHSDGSYDYYINVERRINDFKGTNAFIYLATELEY